jgi:hypothetical protein
MPRKCPECGARIPEVGSCRDNFHDLLLLEWQIPGGPGGLSHFFAVAAYGVQHPESMNYLSETVAGLQVALADALAGRATIDQIRRRARNGAKVTGRITRRDGDPLFSWGIALWPMTIADVLGVEPTADAYADRVSRWARAVLDADGKHHAARPIEPC